MSSGSASRSLRLSPIRRPLGRARSRVPVDRARVRRRLRRDGEDHPRASPRARSRPARRWPEPPTSALGGLRPQTCRHSLPRSGRIQAHVLGATARPQARSPEADSNLQVELERLGSQVVSRPTYVTPVWSPRADVSRRPPLVQSNQAGSGSIPRRSLTAHRNRCLHPR